MAIEFTPDNVTSGYNLSKINDNFNKIDVALQDALSRSGNSPNPMNADIDLNSHDLLNVGTITAQDFTVAGSPITGAIQQAVDAAEDAIQAVVDAEAAEAAAAASAASIAIKVVEDRADLEALTAPPVDAADLVPGDTLTVFTTDPELSERWDWVFGNQSAAVTNDYPTYPAWAAPDSAPTGASGAWVISGAIPTGGHWIDIDSPGPRIFRKAGRMLIGSDAQNAWLGFTYSIGVTEGTWVMSELSDDLRYLEKGAQLVVTADDGPASLFTARTSSTNYASAAKPYVAGIGIVVWNDYASGAVGAQTGLTHSSVWGMYKEAYRIQGAGPAITTEFEVVNLGNEPTFYSAYGARNSTVATDLRTLAFGMGIGSGAGQGSNPDFTLYDATAAIYIVNNGARFRTGLVFTSQSLTGHAADGSTSGRAIEMAIGMENVWVYGSGLNQKSFTIGSIGNDASRQTIMRAETGSWRLRTVRSDLTTLTNPGFQIIWPVLTGVQDINGLAVTPSLSGSSGSVTIGGNGADATIGIIVLPKGVAGSIFLRGGSGNTIIQINETGIGFHGTTPVTSTAWTMPTGTPSKFGFATYTAPTIGGTYSQAQVQAIADHTQILSRHLAAVILALGPTTGNGMFRV